MEVGIGIRWCEWSGMVRCSSRR